MAAKFIREWFVSSESILVVYGAETNWQRRGTTSEAPLHQAGAFSNHRIRFSIDAALLANTKDRLSRFSQRMAEIVRQHEQTSAITLFAFFDLVSWKGLW
jgi:hypothetical protein